MDPGDVKFEFLVRFPLSHPLQDNGSLPCVVAVMGGRSEKVASSVG